MNHTDFCTRLALITGILLASFSSIASAQAQVQANDACGSLVEVTSLPLTSAGVSIPASIGGSEFRMTIATGTQTSLLSDEEAQSIGLAPRSLGGTLFTIGGMTPTHFVQAQDFRLGKLVAPDWTLVLVPGAMFSNGVRGAVGADFLHSYDVDLDFGQGKFRLVSPEHCAGHVVYWTKDPVAVVPMTLDRKWLITIPATLDTVETTAAIDTAVPQSLIAGAFAREAFRSTAFRALSLEGVTISNPKLAVVPDMAAGEGAAPLIIGQDLLRRFHVYIAYGEKRLYLTGANAH